MSKKVTKFNLWWHMSRRLLYVIFVNIASFALANFIQVKALGFVPDKEKWIKWAIIINSIAILLFIIVYIVIVNKSKTKKTFVDMEAKICIENGRKMRYQSYEYSHTLMQKLLGLCNIKFKNSVETMNVKDVSIEAVRRLEQF